MSVTSRVAARGFSHQITALGQAEDAAADAERHVADVWARLLAIIRRHGGPHDFHATYAAITGLLRPLTAGIVQKIAGSVSASAEQAYAMSAETLAEQLPLPSVRASVSEGRLVERQIPSTDPPGFIDILQQGLRDLTRPFRRRGRDRLSDEGARDLFKAMIFPPPSEDMVRAVVFQSDWVQRLTIQTQLAGPDAIASRVVQSLSAGQKINDLARELLPVVNGVRSTARRIARDETMHAAHTMQHAAWAQLGPMVVGFQIHAVLDDRTRPAHRARDGQVYYKQPTAGQKGMNECPQPPREADGTHAYNCRCFLTPALQVADAAGNNLTPTAPLDPQITGEWFADASARDQRLAVGTERYELARASLGRSPQWSDFTDAGGQILTVDSLRARLREKLSTY